MKDLNNLERRVSFLERPQSMGGIDPLVLVMETLNDSELGLLDEYFGLLKAGFAQAEISEMMGDESYQQTLAIADKIEEELRLRQWPGPKKRAEPKKRGRPRKDKERKDKPGACVACQD